MVISGVRIPGMPTVPGTYAVTGAPSAASGVDGTLALEPGVRTVDILADGSGLRVGCLVEIHGLGPTEIAAVGADVNGVVGQIVSYAGGRFYVYLVCGLAAHFEPRNVRAAAAFRRPGEGGTEKSFDILMAPRTSPQALTSEMTTCLLEKGFFVIRVCQSAQLLKRTLDKLRYLSEEGRMGRFAEETEEGYLGIGCRAKVAWFDRHGRGGSSSLFGDDDLLTGSDSNLSYLAQLLQPSAPDLLGDTLDERTPGLVAMSLSEEEEMEFPFPEPDDATLGSFLTMWRRTLVRAVHFMGPGTAKVTLDSREDSVAAEKMPNPQANFTLLAEPNTILLFRPDVYEYQCEFPEETVMLISNFLSPSPQMVFSHLEGDVSWLTTADTGPPPPPGDQHIHVVNTVARLPGQWDHQWAYFAGLKAATDTVVEIPFTRWDWNIYWTANEDAFEPWQTTTKHQSFCEGAELFDNKHFEISNAEASGMDPVQRLILECGAQSLAMIGLTKKNANRKSTHGGFAVGNDKLDWMTCDKEIAIGAACGGTSTVLAIIANRFSFVFNMKGPNFVCDTACSASLTSTHCAKMMIAERKFDPLEFFLTMGAHLCLSPGPFIGCSQAHMSSPTGRCFTFNASANGYLRGEGVSGFMMKFGNYKGESDAILRATQVGQDGRSASLTAPNGPAQEEMVSRAIKEAQMTPPESTVWECHGTGTSLGDPIEVGAVRKVQIRMPRSEPLMITSNKTNIGHLEGGAAMAAMVKCILQCKHVRCCPTLHMRTLNPHLEHAAFDAIFQSEAAAYHYNSGHSQVSSFGFGGTNAHGIFWGHAEEVNDDVEKLWLKKLRSKPPPEVRPMGRNPDDWEADFPDTRSLKRGAKFLISLNPDDGPDSAVRYELTDEGVDECTGDDFAKFAISGNFNDWADGDSGALIMSQGDVPGAHVAIVEVPDTGVLEFRLLKSGDAEQVIGPSSPEGTRMSEAILGPQKELENRWVIRATPGREVRLEFFSRRNRKAIMWFLD